MLATAYAAGFWTNANADHMMPHSSEAKNLYDIPPFGNVSLIHFTDCHAQLLPIFSKLIEPDRAMTEYVNKVRAPFLDKLTKKLAVSDELLYRRGTFNGTFDQLILDALLEGKGAEIAFSPGFRWGTNILPGQTITMEDVMSQTAITYPATTLNEITGATIKDILEDVADNRFNVDPYMQQGGDMARVGGLDYSIDPTVPKGKRISDMEVAGKKVQANKKYKVAGWASVAKDVQGKPMWDVVAEYLQAMKQVKVNRLSMPKIKNVKGNPGIADELT